MIKFRKYSITERGYKRGDDGAFVPYTKVVVKWIPSFTIKLKAPEPWWSFRWLNSSITWTGKFRPELMNWPLIYPHSVVEDGEIKQIAVNFCYKERSRDFRIECIEGVVDKEEEGQEG